MEAKGKVDRKTGEVKRAGRVTQEMMDELARGAVMSNMRGAGLDESPDDCYKRLPDVLAEHGDSIKNPSHAYAGRSGVVAGANRVYDQRIRIEPRSAMVLLLDNMAMLQKHSAGPLRLRRNSIEQFLDGT